MMGRIEKIIVSIQFSANEIEVGELVSNDSDIFFKYYPEFLKKQLAISPFKLPLKEGVIKADASLFNGLFKLDNIC